jgi:hypothetical protein
MSAQPDPAPAREPDACEEPDGAFVHSHEDFDEEDGDFELDDGS